MNLENKKIIIATHVYTTGPAQDLRDYLISQKCSKLLFIGHPLLYHNKLKGSGYEIFEAGVKRKEKYSKLKNNFNILKYCWDCCRNILITIQNGRNWDLYVGSNNLNALSGILLRRLGLVKHCVYYVIDYNPFRFRNRILNKIYHKIDLFCVRNADETWNLSERMSKARKKYFGFSGGKQVVVPIGIWYRRFEKFQRLDFSNNYTLVYMGHILKKQGIQDVLNAIPLIVKDVPQFKFMVIGAGDYLLDLKACSRTLGIGRYVKFTGFIEKHEDVEKLLSKCTLAIAMYQKFNDDGSLTFTYFSDPGKIKSYLASGLPILLTDVPYNAKEIEDYRCGKIISPEPKSIAKAVVAMLKNEKVLVKMRQNALRYAMKYDWEIIYAKNLKRILKHSIIKHHE